MVSKKLSVISVVFSWAAVAVLVMSIANCAPDKQRKVSIRNGKGGGPAVDVAKADKEGADANGTKAHGQEPEEPGNGSNTSGQAPGANNNVCGYQSLSKVLVDYQKKLNITEAQWNEKITQHQAIQSPESFVNTWLEDKDANKEVVFQLDGSTYEDEYSELISFKISFIGDKLKIEWVDVANEVPVAKALKVKDKKIYDLAEKNQVGECGEPVDRQDGKAIARCEVSFYLMGDADDLCSDFQQRTLNLEFIGESTIELTYESFEIDTNEWIKSNGIVSPYSSGRVVPAPGATLLQRTTVTLKKVINDDD